MLLEDIVRGYRLEKLLKYKIAYIGKTENILQSFLIKYKANKG